MFKISFKKDYKKVQTFNDKATLVTLVGEMRMPTAVWQTFPSDVANWMWDHSGVDAQWGTCTKFYEAFRLEVSGKSVCAEGNTFDPVVGQRIAESKAKIKLYKFMHTLIDQLCDYYGKLLLGYIGFIPSSTIKDSLYSELEKYQELWIKESHHLGKLLKEAS